MGELTERKPKCLVQLADGSTLLSRQMDQIVKCGIEDILITTGPFESMITDYVEKKYGNVRVRYVCNPMYQHTNYIYSMYLAKKYLVEDILLLHGDIVMSDKCLPQFLSGADDNCVIVDSRLPLPDKDFKAEIRQGRIHRIGVDVNGEHCLPLFPVYLLSKDFMTSWMRAIESFVEQKNVKVYAENALNKILGTLELLPYDLRLGFCREIDTTSDLQEINTLLEEKV